MSSRSIRIIAPLATLVAVLSCTGARRDGLGVMFAVTGKVVQSRPSTCFKSGIYPPCL